MKYLLQILVIVAGITIHFSAYGQEITSYDTINPKNDNLTPLVSAINMNVLYLGLDNPVQISVPGKFDEVIVECNGGRISGNNGNYIIKPSSTKDVIISIFTVTKGKIQDTTQYSFRVKKVPTPEITWCNKVSGETIKASCVGGYSYTETCGGGGPTPLIPRMADFDFAVYATIQSFDIEYSLNGKLIERKENKGNQIPKDIANEIKSLPVGTNIFFTNVRIVCPGGDTRISSATFIIE